ncbi:DNA-binding protein [Schlegelella sp. S2-27]|uniref:DNA-binding protein n=1 Tax=Caldimonas mangrovi TaxID=2944811 RepID=A0ABT0YRP7_9BURK|nr:PPC domain-containing DNA-binding protein [Caldimonas mangrovi]MCM5681402.1 DNA-binding protein [Caldimonas mangrovi]
MRTLPLRLSPGQDLRRALEAALATEGVRAAFVLSGVGSLDVAQLRLAGAEAPVALQGPIEILTLAGTLSDQGSHLHAALSLADGRVLGGHVAPGCMVRTTAEVLLAALPEWEFRRMADAATGYRELVIRRRDAAQEPPPR